MANAEVQKVEEVSLVDLKTESATLFHKFGESLSRSGFLQPGYGAGNNRPVAEVPNDLSSKGWGVYDLHPVVVSSSSLVLKHDQKEGVLLAFLPLDVNSTYRSVFEKSMGDLLGDSHIVNPDWNGGYTRVYVWGDTILGRDAVRKVTPEALLLMNRKK